MIEVTDDRIEARLSYLQARLLELIEQVGALQRTVQQNLATIEKLQVTVYGPE